MQITDYQPAEQLRTSIKAYKIIESRFGTTNRVLPSTSLALSFRFKGQIAYLKDKSQIPLNFATFSGLQKTARLINYGTDTSAIIVLFKEAGLPAFFRQPLHELFGQSISLDHFFPASEILMVQEQIANAKSNLARIEALETFLLSKLNNFSADKLITTAIRKIKAENGNVRIKQLADELFISQDAFGKRFRKITGATPKQFSHIVKMNAAITQHSNDLSFLDMALTNGYYDQPHFNKDFKTFTGQTPADFFRSALYW